MATRAPSIFAASATFACQEQPQYSAVNQSNRDIYAVERNLAARAIAIFCSPKATATVCLWTAATVTVCLPRATKIFCAQPERPNRCILLAARACQESACSTMIFCAQQEHLRSFAPSLAESNCHHLLGDYNRDILPFTTLGMVREHLESVINESYCNILLTGRVPAICICVS
jgi:hypothetical protein